MKKMSNVSQHKYLITACLLILFYSKVAFSQEAIPDLNKFCSEQKGFNLLGMFDVSWSNAGFSEKEFSMVRDLGFNFVRLPVDYRTYTQTGDWYDFVESKVQRIDYAIIWGKKYGIHVCLNLHRAPGYSVAAGTLPPGQDLNLWTDTAAQRAFVAHWEFFAKRYAAISPAQLSFNLVNEPAGISAAEYLPVMRMAIKAIHDIDPDRLIFVDGLEYGRILLSELKDEPNVAEGMHCYDPSALTHYKAEWVSGFDKLPVPRWPILTVNQYLFGPWKSEYRSPLVIHGSFPAGTKIIVNIRQVSIESTLEIRAGNRLILSKHFVCTADTGNDFSEVVNTQWGYQNISNKDFIATADTDADSLSFANSSGDWMTVNSIEIIREDQEVILVLGDNSWGIKQQSYLLDENGILKSGSGDDLLPFNAYQANIDLARENGIPLMVQEFGVYNKTPWDVTISFLSDLVSFFKKNNLGYAMWNFNGSIGILNSGRSDCPYEDYQGYLLDTAMLRIMKPDPGNSSGTHSHLQQVLAYPVPAKESICLIVPNRTDSPVELFDIKGNLVRTYDPGSTGSDMVQLDISGLSPQVYIIRGGSVSREYSVKVVVQ